MADVSPRLLYSERNLAQALGCSRRTIVSVESGKEVIAPHFDLQRRFRDLKRQRESERATRGGMETAA